MKKTFTLVALVTVFVATASFAVPIINSPEVWGASPSVESWEVDTTLGSGTPTITNPSGALLLTLPDTGNPLARVYADSDASGGDFYGNFNNLATTLLSGSSNLMVQFTFRSVTDVNVNPGALSLYFIGGGNLYTISLAQPAVSLTPTTYYLNIGSSSSWVNWDSGTFATDFGSVTQFGFEVAGNSSGGPHLYEIDDVVLLGELVVPEPETVWMIVIVLSSLGITFRSRLSEIVGQVKAHIKA